MQKKILITGAAGFIGSHLADFLLKQKNVSKLILLDNLEDGSLKNLKSALKSKKVKFFKRDIRNFNNIKNLFKDVNIVFHLAALSDVVPSIEEPLDYLNTNVMGTVNILESMRKNNVKKIIYSASSSCYGIPKNFPTKENENIDPRYPYAFSKNLGEKTIIHWSKVYNLDYVSLRLFNVYGTRSRTNSAYGAALGVFIKQKLSNHPFTVIGSGKQKRDFIYVDDVVKAFYASTKNKLKIRFLILEVEIKVCIRNVKNSKGKRIYIPKRPGEPNITHADITLTKKLKWKPGITLEKILKMF